MLQEAQVKAEERMLMSLRARAETTMEETREADGTGSLWTAQVPPAPRASFGNKGGHTRQRAPGRAALVQFERGRVPAASIGPAVG